jgi:hypothetical protein
MRTKEEIEQRLVEIANERRICEQRQQEYEDVVRAAYEEVNAADSLRREEWAQEINLQIEAISLIKQLQAQD